MSAPCCPPGSHGPAPFANEPVKGKMVDILPPDGSDITNEPLQCYCTGASLASCQRLVILFSDVFGIETGNQRAFCDTLVERLGEDTAVIAPDLFRGNPICQPWFSSFLSESWGVSFAWPAMIYRLRYQVPPPKVESDISDLIFPWLLSQGVDLQKIKLSCVGFCFGGWVVGHALAMKDLGTEGVEFQCGVGIHPGFIVEVIHGGTEASVGSKIGNKPCLLLPACNDVTIKASSNTVKIMAEARGIAPEEVAVEFPDMYHGWVARGNSKHEKVRKNQEKAIEMTVNFIQQYS